MRGAGFCMLACMALVGPVGAANPAQRVLPGFEGLHREGNAVEVYARRYRWEDSVLPSMVSRGTPLADCRLSVPGADGSATVLARAESTWMDSLPASSEYRAAGRYATLAYRVRSVVDYDGFIDTTLVITPADAHAGQTVDLVCRVRHNANTRIHGFSAAGIRRQKDRDDRVIPPYHGEFLHAIGVADGERSFWWVTDSAEHWAGADDGSPGTTITADGDAIAIRQRIAVNAGSVPVSVRFGLLATPVRPLDAGFRAERAISGRPSLTETGLGTKFILWWPTAFAYDTYPYIRLDAAAAQRVTPGDRDAYPGPEKNLRYVENTRRRFGINVLPYFSAHALSLLDPVVRRNRDAWEIRPPNIFRGGVGPWSARFDKPTLSHNAAGYTDYVLTRFDELIDALSLDGVYLDHGPVWDSTLPAHGGWVGPAGDPRPALDIFATREFLKRLRMLFDEKNRAGYVFVHVSNREIIPAYTFAHAIVDGEQYKGRVTNGNYLALVTPAEFRTRFSPDQYGVLNYFLPSDWAAHAKDRTWPGSQDQRMSYRRAFGLSLLHDVPMWHHGYHAGERQRLLGLLDGFGIAGSEFIGYWTADSLLEPVSDTVLVSEYRRGDQRLAVILNTENRPRDVRLRYRRGEADACGAAALAPRRSDARIMGPADDGDIRLRIDALDFALLALKDSDDCASARNPDEQ